MLAKRKYKVRLLAQPIPSIPTSTAPVPMVATVSTQTPLVRATARVYTSNSIQIGNRKICWNHMSNNQTPEQRIQPPWKIYPNTLARQGTPWPKTGSASENLFETRKDWPISLTPTPTSSPTVKTEAPPQVAVIPHVMLMPK